MNADEYLRKLRQNWRDVSASSAPDKAERLKSIEAEGTAIKALHESIGVEEVITGAEQAQRQSRRRR